MTPRKEKSVETLKTEYCRKPQSGQYKPCSKEKLTKRPIPSGEIPKIRKVCKKAERLPQCTTRKDIILSDQRHLSVSPSKRRHSDKRSFNCDICSASFKKKSHLQVHVQAVHDNIKDFKCGECSFAATTKGTLARHYNERHSKTHIFNCDLCHYTSARKENIKIHTKNVHGKFKTFKCLLCTATYQDRESLQGHIERTHEIGSQFRCIICDFATTTKNNLDNHIKTHGSETSFVCTQCQRSFHRRGSLNKHIREYHTLRSSNLYKPLSLCIPVEDIAEENKTADRVATWLEKNDFHENPYYQQT